MDLDGLGDHGLDFNETWESNLVKKIGLAC